MQVNPGTEPEAKINIEEQKDEERSDCYQNSKAAMPHLKDYPVKLVSGQVLKPQIPTQTS